MRSTSVIYQASIIAISLALSSALAQTVGGNREEKQSSPVPAEPRYSETSLKFDILEAQLQTLRKKMQLRSKMSAEQTKEWNEHYTRVKQQIEAWDDFVEAYDVE